MTAQAARSPRDRARRSQPSRGKTSTTWPKTPTSTPMTSSSNKTRPNPPVTEPLRQRGHLWARPRQISVCYSFIHGYPTPRKGESSFLGARSAPGNLFLRRISRALGFPLGFLVRRPASASCPLTIGGNYRRDVEVPDRETGKRANGPKSRLAGTQAASRTGGSGLTRPADRSRPLQLFAQQLKAHPLQGRFNLAQFPIHLFVSEDS